MVIDSTFAFMKTTTDYTDDTDLKMIMDDTDLKMIMDDTDLAAAASNYTNCVRTWLCREIAALAAVI